MGASFPSPQKMRDFLENLNVSVSVCLSLSPLHIVKPSEFLTVRVCVSVCVSLSSLHIIKPSEFLSVRGGHPIAMNSGSSYISHLLIGVSCIHLLYYA
jgi:hypothetical protein